MRYLTFLLIMCVSVCSYASIEVTDEQYANLDIIHSELLLTYPNFIGFNGSQGDMDVIGMNENTAKTEMDSMNITNLKKKDPRRKALKKVRNKLKASGLDDDDLDYLGLTNDIPDV